MKENMTIDSGIDGISDEFPVGMRVLAVDDNPTCLMVLETLLRKCEYNVTTTRDAITALELMRENKNKFDLVISDVDMPGMDGFKLLEYVGIEMDLPVIMLSSYGDKDLVMKGITYGACDYLLKPVRFEELKNIWQHVFRRKKLNSKDRKNCDGIPGEPGGVREEFKEVENIDNNVKTNRKRKDQDNRGDGECEEKERHIEDSSTQKKPRVIWTADLHRRFVAAVNQLGFDKAVPKRILELMNDDMLTRENVASHLQKYRLFLKKYRETPFHSVDSIYGRTSTEFDRVQNMVVPNQRLNAGYRPYSTPTMISRLNTPTGLGLCGLSSSGALQWGQTDDTVHVNGHERNLHPSIQSVNQSVNVLHGMPAPLAIGNREHKDEITQIADFSSTDFDSFNDNSTGRWESGDNTWMRKEHLLNGPTEAVFGNSTAPTSTSDFSPKFPLIGQRALHSDGYSAEQCHWRDDIPTRASQTVINAGYNYQGQMPNQNIVSEESFHQPNHFLGMMNCSVVPEVDNLFCQTSEFRMNDDDEFSLVRRMGPDDPFAA